MNETMVYADGFEKTFATAEEMLDFLSRRGKASEWIRKPIRALRLVPLEKEADNLDNGDAEVGEILTPVEGYGKAHPACTEGTRRGISGPELCNPDNLRTCRYRRGRPAKAGSGNLCKGCELLPESSERGMPHQDCGWKSLCSPRRRRP